MNSLSFPYPVVDFEVSIFFHSNLNMQVTSIASHCNTSEFNLNDQVLSETDFAVIDVAHTDRKDDMANMTNIPVLSHKDNLLSQLSLKFSPV